MRINEWTGKTCTWVIESFLELRLYEMFIITIVIMCSDARVG